MDYWSKVIKSPSWYSWAGYAFESVCYKHIDKIIQALGLSKTGCFVSFWRYQVSSLDIKENDAQIDLLLDREYGAISICEIKFTSNPFVIDKTVAKDLVRKLDVFSEQTKTKKQLFLAIVSAYGVKENPWSQELVSGVVDLDNFFNI